MDPCWAAIALSQEVGLHLYLQHCEADRHTLEKWFITNRRRNKPWSCHVVPVWRGPKYRLLAHTTLKLQHVQEGFKSHNLSLAATGYFSTSIFSPNVLSSLILSLFLFFRGWPILGAPVWQHMLLPARPASLHESANHKRPAPDYGTDMVLCHFVSITFRYFNPQHLPLMSFSRGRTLDAGQVSLGSSGGRSCCVSRVRKTLNVKKSHWQWSQSKRFVLIV